jgi:hypothetical protein
MACIVKSKMLGFVVTPEFHAEVFETCDKHAIKVGDFLRSAVERELKRIKQNKE